MIKGTYYPGTASTPHVASLRVDECNQVHVDGVDIAPFDVAQLEIEPRIGNAARLLRLPNNASFQTTDNAAADSLQQTYFANQNGFVAHHWETRLKLIAVSVVLSVGLVFGLIKWGVPAAAKAIAHRLPSEFSVMLAEGTLDQLDGSHFEPSKLPPARKQALLDLFNHYLPTQSEFNFRLEFRASPRIGANAFALPDGTVVITDELVALTEDDNELLSVLFHEMGHVVSRHSLRGVIQAAGAYGIYSWLTGDMAASSGLITLLPLVLTQSSYSRALEWEADTYALAQLNSANVDPKVFAKMMDKLERSHQQKRQNDKKEEGEEDAKASTEKDPAETEDVDGSAEKPQTDQIDWRSWSSYISSHPPSQERIKRFEEASNQWQGVSPSHQE